MKTSLLACVSVLACSAAAACELPALVSVPEKVDDVVSVLRDVRRYSDAVIEYTGCVKAELAAAGGDAAPPSLRQALVRRNNLAVAEHKAITDLYVLRIGPLANLRLAEYLAAESKDCVYESWVKRTAVINDGAVVFFGRDQLAYLNVLDGVCDGLARDGAFVVRFQRDSRGFTQGVQGNPLICDANEIYPYKETGARSVVSCGIGRFYALTEDQALALLVEPDGESASEAQ
jgi:hypothetical protein